MQLFYAPDALINPYLSIDESNHCVRALRHQEGDLIHIIDGKGNFIEARIMHADPKSCQFEIVNKKKSPEQRKYKVHIAIAPTKNNSRFEWFAEKATEIGIDMITPIICTRSERRKINYDRLHKVLVTAMKQSLKAFLPVLNQPTELNRFLLTDFTSSKKLLAIQSEESVPLYQTVDKNKNVVILVGPEGNFSPQEINLAVQNEWIPISLGRHRLRTETAGIVACQNIHFFNEM
jgi:16S rRNA (uracil1498-N3)-methyltransferase